MPIVSVDAARLNGMLGRTLPPEDLARTLDQIGVDVDDVLDIARYRCPSCASLVEGSLGVAEVKACEVCGHASETPFALVDRVTSIRLDLLAARPDLFDIAGLARALKGYLGDVRGLPRIETPPSGVRLVVDPSVSDPESWRPFIRCAVVELPPIDDETLALIMKMQENLHWGVGRDRKLASIGVYDLDKLSPPFTYCTMAKTDAFEPLGVPGQQMTGAEILASHPKGVAYAHLLADHVRYPVLLDAEGKTLSMPPIINAHGCRLQPGSSRLFIDVTGTSDAAVASSLRVLVCSLVELGATVSSVEIVRPVGASFHTPDLRPRTAEVSLSRAVQWLGLPLDAASLTDCFERMRLDVRPLDHAGSLFEVSYPAYRSDIRHMVDLFEDLAIGFGYHNIQPAMVPTMTVGKPRPEEVVSEIARSTLLGLGYTEVMSLPLTTEAEHYELFGMPVPQRYPRVSNPKLKAYTVVRSHLMTGVMGALRENRRRPMPLRLFECNNVTIIDDTRPTGVRDERRLCFVEMGPDAGYAHARSVLDALLWELGLEGSYAAVSHPAFVPGRVAEVKTSGAVHARVGELHPAALVGFRLDQPVALVEVVLEILAPA